jgi:hypothetical protein
MEGHTGWACTVKPYLLAAINGGGLKNTVRAI